MGLRVLSESAERQIAAFRTTAAPVSIGDGFHEVEHDELHRFRWMQLAGDLHIESVDATRFLELWVFSAFKDLSQVLRITGDGWQEERILPSGWARISVPVGRMTRQIRLAVNKPLPRDLHPDDARILAIRVREGAFVHQDVERHERIDAQFGNQILNRREMLAGKTVLESTPTTLGIDMYGVCNVKPPCVYCDWDTSKEMEGAMVEVPFTRETLDEWGELFSGAHNLVNCSIGEPFMMKNFDELLDIFGDRGKALEMTTNGQILTDRNIEKLLDRDIDLYISLDAATAETYARLRNDTFEKILVNLRRLIRAKGGREGLPRVHLVFMPMRCNVDELEAFIDLCADLEVDRLVLRPLNFSEGISLKWEREGYVFDYPQELLPFEQLIEVSRRAARLCRLKGLPLSDQMDFGGSLEVMFGEADSQPETQDRGETVAPQVVSSAAEEVSTEETRERVSLGEEDLPACTEPWSSLYILRRGIHPCCYGGHPIAAMDEFDQAWNSKTVQEIRGALAAGKFHRYCLRSPACPIVRKDSHAGVLPGAQTAFLKGREALQRVDRRLGGLPARIYRPLIGGIKKLVGRGG
jgi:MoaA/NifB/PqqE/SkfB family radical SAM enzyme